MSTLRTKYLCPISGDEWDFETHSLLFKGNIQGSNCYSYAMNHPMPNGKRPHKSIPGLLSRTTHNETDWQSCSVAVKRLLADGQVVAKMNNLKKNITTPTSIKARPKPGHRKIVMVVESDAAPKTVPTDFHFYAQNKIAIEDLYKQKLSIHMNPKRKFVANPYSILNIPPFWNDRQIKQYFIHHPNKMNKFSNLLDPVKRAILNIRIHLDRIPLYMIDFIVNPFWILNCKKSEASIKHMAGILKKIMKNKILSKIIKNAENDALNIIKGKYKVPHKAMFIGTWSHKLGWGTEPLNTDGNGKLIFNPEKANRNHSNRDIMPGRGMFDYDKSCGAFDVVIGYGASSK
tara:strand:- start:12884 stop:13918 length:1035 start_codon:yes stop_codon:yes gene_type:complete